jgi:hypothetical protein
MNKQGTGLGLSICKKLIEQMGGKVEVSSKLGAGTTFTVNIKTKCFKQPCSVIRAQDADLEEVKSLMRLEKARAMKFESFGFNKIFSEPYCFLMQKAEDKEKILFLLEKLPQSILQARRKVS